MRRRLTGTDSELRDILEARALSDHNMEKSFLIARHSIAIFLFGKLNSYAIKVSFPERTPIAASLTFIAGILSSLRMAA